MRTEMTHIVGYSDLESFVKKVYGFDYSFVVAEECGNDTQHSFSVTDEPLDEYEEEEFDRMFSGKFVMYSTSVLLQKLAIDKHIPTGTYLIEVSW